MGWASLLNRVSRSSAALRSSPCPDVGTEVFGLNAANWNDNRERIARERRDCLAAEPTMYRDAAAIDADFQARHATKATPTARERPAPPGACGRSGQDGGHLYRLYRSSAVPVPMGLRWIVDSMNKGSLPKMIEGLRAR